MKYMIAEGLICDVLHIRDARGDWSAITADLTVGMALSNRADDKSSQQLAVSLFQDRTHLKSALLRVMKAKLR